MAERTDQLSREDDAGEVDLDAIMDDQPDTTNEDVADDTSDGFRSRLGRRFGKLFSIRTFGIALVLTIALAFVAGAIVPFVPDNITGLFGVFLAGMTVGVGSADRRYLEVGAAALMAGALTILLSNFTIAVFGPGVPLVAIGAGSSGVAGLVGHYVGRDLRAGLTRDIE